MIQGPIVYFDLDLAVVVRLTGYGGRAMNPSRRTASQADDDLNIDTRTMYSSDCTVVLSQANSSALSLSTVTLPH